MAAVADIGMHDLGQADCCQLCIIYSAKQASAAESQFSWLQRSGARDIVRRRHHATIVNRRTAILLLTNQLLSIDGPVTI